MAVATNKVSVPSNTVTAIVPAANSNAQASGYTRMRTVVLKNVSSWGIYIGDSAVSASTGYLLASGDAPISFQIGVGDAIYGLAVQNTAVVTYLVTG